MSDLDETTRESEELRELLDLTMRDLEAPHSTHLYEAGRELGRRIRRRRRARVAVGLAACVGLAAVVVPALAPGSDTDGVRSPELASDAPSAVRTDPAGWWDMPAPEMLDLLKEQLPPGSEVVDSVVRNVDRAPSEPAGFLEGWLAANITTPESDGPGGVNVVLYAPTTSTDDQSDGQPDGQPGGEGPIEGEPTLLQRLSCPGNLTNPDQCTELYAGGQPTGRTSVWSHNGVTVLEVVIRTDDDGLVYLATSNSDDDKWGPGSTVSASEPPLTLAQLKTIARDPSWISWTP